MSLKVIAVIPARMGSSRFPGKPLIPILGLPMIEHVRRRVELIKSVHEVYVATCDKEIKDVVEGHGGKVIMTKDTHERATDRIEEAATKLNGDIIINVQGDEPMVSAQSIEDVVKPFFENSKVQCSCLVYPIKNLDELQSLNVVKCVLSNSKKILYFSRAAIPGKDVQNNFNYFKQSGIMAFTKNFLHSYSRLAPTPLEAKESVDLMRILEHDHWVQGVLSNDETKGVDVPEQVGEIEKAIMADPKQRELFQIISREK